MPASRITEINNQANAFNQMLDALRWFETYVPRTLVRSLVRQHGAAAVASQERMLTVMFQSPIPFFSTVAQNIRLGDLKTADDGKKMAWVAQQASKAWQVRLKDPDSRPFVAVSTWLQTNESFTWTVYREVMPFQPDAWPESADG